MLIGQDHDFSDGKWRARASERSKSINIPLSANGSGSSFLFLVRRSGSGRWWGTCHAANPLCNTIVDKLYLFCFVSQWQWRGHDRMDERQPGHCLRVSPFRNRCRRHRHRRDISAKPAICRTKGFCLCFVCALPEFLYLARFIYFSCFIIRCIESCMLNEADVFSSLLSLHLKAALK